LVEKGKAKICGASMGSVAKTVQPPVVLTE
jgi:hypothetical protein